MNKKIIYIFIIIISGVIIISNMKKNLKEFDELTSFERMVLNYYDREFNGVIIDKYIDKDDRNSEKIRIKNQMKEEVIYLNFEDWFFFNDLSVGDSISKKSKDSRIFLKRGDNISVIRFDFKDYYERHKYHKNIDSVISKFLKEKKYID